MHAYHASAACVASKSSLYLLVARSVGPFNQRGGPLLLATPGPWRALCPITALDSSLALSGGSLCSRKPASPYSVVTLLVVGVRVKSLVYEAGAPLCSLQHGDI